MDSSADDRYPLSFYYRIADQMVKQAAVFRGEEGNADDLYITLKRYLRLVADVVPSHRSYSKCCSKRKLHHSKILQDFIKEIEDLKPLVETNNSEIAKQVPSRPNTGEANSHLMFQRWKEKDWAFVSYKEGKVNHCSTTRAEDPNFKGNIVNTYLAPELAADTLNSCNLFQTRTRVAFAAERKHVINVNVVKHHSPSVLSFIESPPIVGHVSQITIPESRNEYLESSCEASSSSRNIKDVHISARLMEEFMELARANTNEDLETCGILGASLNNQTFYITTLIIPRQESTSNSCQALNEEQIYAIQDERSLFTAGWIHTHPSQTCFLSSIDLHTQYSYQVMLPEAVAIVMAPTDPTRNYGIFRLTDPGGMSVLRHCQESGFHTHSETADGSPIYECCSNVYINPNLRFETIDLRFRSP